jgi:hypothetical protein
LFFGERAFGVRVPIRVRQIAEGRRQRQRAENRRWRVQLREFHYGLRVDNG